MHSIVAIYENFDIPDSDDFSTMQEVNFVRVKEEITVDTDESFPFEIPDYVGK